MRDERIPPDVAALLTELQHHRVEFILAGSVGVEAWGVDIGTPGDLDIVPSTGRDNLSRLVKLLQEIDAKAWPMTGRWIEEGSDVRWEEFAADDPRRNQPLPYPDPDRIETFDSLFSTRLGELDIVPRISGTYDLLRPRASQLQVRGIDNILVTHLDDLLALLKVPRRRKDADRVSALRERQRTRDLSQFE